MKLTIFEGHYTETATLEDQVNTFGNMNLIVKSDVVMHGNTLMIFVWHHAAAGKEATA